jgi:hypothetical protein
MSENAQKVRTWWLCHCDDHNSISVVIPERASRMEIAAALRKAAIDGLGMDPDYVQAGATFRDIYIGNDMHSIVCYLPTPGDGLLAIANVEWKLETY